MISLFDKNLNVKIISFLLALEIKSTLPQFTKNQRNFIMLWENGHVGRIFAQEFAEILSFRELVLGWKEAKA